MKLHLNLTLRRAVLTAMAMVAVSTAQAEVSISNSGTPDVYVTGDGELSADDWNNISANPGTDTVSIINTPAGETVTLTHGTYKGNQILYIGGKGHGSSAAGTNGSLTVGKNTTLDLSNAVHIGVSQEQVIGKLTINGGSVIAGSELTVGAYKGTGIVGVSNGGTLTVNTDADGGVLRVGYHNGGGQNPNLEDGIYLDNGTLTVGVAGGIKDMTSIGHENGVASLILDNESTATLNDQTIVGEGLASDGSIFVQGGSKLYLGSLTVLGYSASAEGRILVEAGSVANADVITVGANGKGTAEVDEGSLIANTIILGEQKSGTGDLNISSGSVTVKDNLYVGYLGTGNVENYYGTLEAGNVYVVGTGSILNTVSGTTTLTNATVLAGSINNATEESRTTINGELFLAEGGKLTNDGTVNLENVTIADSGSIENDGDMYLNGSTTNYGSITNDGNLGINASASSFNSLTNNNAVTIKGNGRLTSTELTGTGTTTIVVDDSIMNGTVITLGAATTNTIKVAIDTSSPSALVGKSVDFLSESNTLTGIDHGFISAGNGTASSDIVWTSDYIICGKGENNSESRLYFTESAGSTDTATTGMTFSSAVVFNGDVVESYNTAETASTKAERVEITENTAAGTKTTVTTKIDTSIEGSAITSSDMVITSAVAGTADQKNKTNVIIGKNVTSSGEGTTQAKMLSIDKIHTDGTVEHIDSTGVGLVFSGEVSQKGTGDAILGFAEGSEGVIIKTTVVESTSSTSNSIISETTEKEVIKLVDTIEIEQGSKVELADLDMHATHALNINGTQDNTVKLVISNVEMEIGGAKDPNLFETYTHKDGNGQTVTELIETDHHITTDSKITHAEITIEDGSSLTFKKVTDDSGKEMGTVTIENCVITSTSDTTLGSTEEHMDTIELANSVVKGTGVLRNFSMKGGKLIAGNSPGQRVLDAGSISNTELGVCFISTGDWNFSGDNNNSDSLHSQFVCDGAVTLDNVVFFVQYEDYSPNGYFASDSTALNNKFQDGASITLIDGYNNMTGTYSFDASTLPVLEDGLFWDTTQLLTTGKIFVYGEILEEPVRVANSMVSAGETVLNFGRVAEAQAKLRKAGTTRVWGSALGSFDSVDSDGARTGYDYNSWGGAVGVDHAFTSRTVLGVAFGCSWGENEAEKDNGYYSAGSIDQDASMVGFYGTHKFRTKGLMNDMKLSAFAAYGQFENSSSRKGIKSGHNATAEWDSDAWVLSASLSRDITTDSGLVVTPYVGVEYTKAGMDDFTEKGKSYNATYTAEEDYSNLAVKVGVSVSKTIGSFTPYAGIAYINDVARDTPKVTASGKRTITGEASMPGRSAVQLNLGTGVKLSDSWDAYAGYTAELRSKATEHNVNVGVGYTF